MKSSKHKSKSKIQARKGCFAATESATCLEFQEEVDADSQRKSTGRQQFPDDDVIMAATTPNKAVQVEGTSINFTSTLVLWNFLPLLLCCSRPQQVLFQFLILLFDYLQIL